ncbi:hypothetical protein HUA74_33745 [Myxococcus sp. CA051A]|uniref:Uncharacterized protein n=1 Tax=Myxococcus llanfairpwllgwyngyllgogerychwyrndrobwllllantysiliogogogochensis TaxID=2590453 RepID=A0A540X8M2_9BACT|nr:MULTISPECIES: hypothetical protein [Myxococcus]NTX08761.1 hypothetical protein [Myxococcus sp. CA040A]NTX11930.1 hypothetical protein [Myxococcus sp. CA056]NTX39206.1 hypothetical protein [Myxococcus sp. CA033]NTX50743.1 hypothetical protein [Myxococcus sp. CA039A]NTX65635.1 hypothetical protein [Myxococcus sp. CA051A]
MVLELSQQQIHLLYACLAESIEDLHDEVIHTDMRELRDSLRDKLHQLQAIQRQVAPLMQREQVVR